MAVVEIADTGDPALGDPRLSDLARARMSRCGRLAAWSTGSTSPSPPSCSSGRSAPARRASTGRPHRPPCRRPHPQRSQLPAPRVRHRRPPPASAPSPAKPRTTLPASVHFSNAETVQNSNVVDTDRVLGTRADRPRSGEFARDAKVVLIHWFRSAARGRKWPEPYLVAGWLRLRAYY
jgi:hypothetical protein